jgi:hypothetical protein
MLNPRGVAIIASATLLFTLDAFGAGKLSRAEVAGSIVGAKGNVLVDRQPVLAKETVFTGDVISTGAASGAFVNLHGVTAILVENSELALSGTGSSSHITLVKGAVVVRNNSPQAARVDVPGAYVLVRGDATFPSICRIAAVNASAVVITDKGSAEIHGAGAPTIVRTGKTVRLENGMPQGGAQHAGTVYKHMPDGYVGNSPTEQGTKLKDRDPIYWGNWVTTEPQPGTGRLQILLDDGSYLNVGVRSKMQVIRHDAQSHQTELEIRAGSVRAAIIKTTGGTKFKCGNLAQPMAACATTPTAVIGVVGTQLQADVSGKGETDVSSIEDEVTVGSTNPNITQTVILHTGQTVHVTANGLGAVGSVASSVMKATTNKTNVKGGLNGNANAATQQLAQQMSSGVGGPAGPAGGLTGAITKGSSNFATVGASGLGAAFGGVAIGKMGSAGDGLTGAGNSLNGAANSDSQAASSASDAASALGAAASASTQATNVETETTTQLQNQQKGCGCPSPNNPD